MAITPPAAYNSTINPLSLFGRVPFAADPLDDILDQTNYLYAHHTPAVANICPINNLRQAQRFQFPCEASADGLDYTVDFAVYRGDTGTADVDIYASSTDTDTWGAAISSFTTASWGAGLSPWGFTAGTVFTATLSALPANTKFLRFDIDAGVGSQCQVHSILVYPAVMTSITTGAKSSGFKGYDNTHLQSSGAAIHTEYFNRALANVAAVLTDRKQCVASWVQHPTSRDVGWDASSSDLKRRLVFRGQCHVPGAVGASLAVRARVDDFGDGSVLRVYEEGGQGVVTLDADDVDNTGTLVLSSDTPMLVCECELAGAHTLYPDYITLDWTPGD